MTTAYRWSPHPADDLVEVTVDGEPVALPAGRSLLAGLLTRSTAHIDFFCAIGQCERCVVRINGLERVACLTRPQAGDVVETKARWSRR